MHGVHEVAGSSPVSPTTHMITILLFYKFTRIDNPTKESLIHKEICLALGLKGRILMNEEGINGTVAGTSEAIALYRAYMNQHRLFKKIDFKESHSDANPFPKLKVKARREIITLDIQSPDALCVRAKHVDRDTFHDWLKKGEDMVLLDMRNDYEWEIGRFVNSVRPPMKYFRELKDSIDFYEPFRGKKIVMFCTGGIRCEPASAYFIAQGFDPSLIYQLEGGIVKYAEKYGNEGFYEGKCFVFDDRLSISINTSDSAVIVGHCYHCDQFNDIYHNCANKWCNKLFLACDSCHEKYHGTCSLSCQIIINDPVNVRPFHTPVLHRNK